MPFPSDTPSFLSYKSCGFKNGLTKGQLDAGRPTTFLGNSPCASARGGRVGAPGGCVTRLRKLIFVFPTKEDTVSNAPYGSPKRSRDMSQKSRCRDLHPNLPILQILLFSNLFGNCFCDPCGQIGPRLSRRSDRSGQMMSTGEKFNTACR
eukprot:COSAG02_NODE_537_length_20638_cov_49.009738_15_plen_150_part_00